MELGPDGMDLRIAVVDDQIVVGDGADEQPVAVEHEPPVAARVGGGGEHRQRVLALAEMPQDGRRGARGPVRQVGQPQPPPNPQRRGLEVALPRRRDLPAFGQQHRRAEQQQVVVVDGPGRRRGDQQVGHRGHQRLGEAVSDQSRGRSGRVRFSGPVPVRRRRRVLQQAVGVLGVEGLLHARGERAGADRPAGLRAVRAQAVAGDGGEQCESVGRPPRRREVPGPEVDGQRQAALQVLDGRLRRRRPQSAHSAQQVGQSLADRLPVRRPQLGEVDGGDRRRRRRAVFGQRAQQRHLRELVGYRRAQHAVEQPPPVVVDARDARVDAEGLDQRRPVGAAVRAPRVVEARHPQVDQRHRALQQRLQPDLGARADEPAPDALGHLRAQRPRRQPDGVRAGGEARGEYRAVDVVLVGRELLVQRQPLLDLLELRHDPFDRPARGIDERRLAGRLQQFAEGRAGREGDVAGARFEHRVVRVGVVQRRHFLHHVAQLGENGRAVEVHDAPVLAPHVAPVADAVPHPVAAVADHLPEPAFALVEGRRQGRLRAVAQEIVVGLLDRRHPGRAEPRFERPQLVEAPVDRRDRPGVGRCPPTRHGTRAERAGPEQGERQPRLRRRRERQRAAGQQGRGPAGEPDAG